MQEPDVGPARQGCWIVEGDVILDRWHSEASAVQGDMLLVEAKRFGLVRGKDPHCLRQGERAGHPVCRVVIAVNHKDRDLGTIQFPHHAGKEQATADVLPIPIPEIAAKHQKVDLSANSLLDQFGEGLATGAAHLVQRGALIVRQAPKRAIQVQVGGVQEGYRHPEKRSIGPLAESDRYRNRPSNPRRKLSLRGEKRSDRPRFMQFSSLTRRIAGPRSRAWDISDRAARLVAQGTDVIQLGIGDPDFATPEPIIAWAHEAMRAGRTHYPALAGEPALRHAIAAYSARGLGFEAPYNEIVVFPGAQCALFAVFSCLAEAGDEVILLEPAYSTYEGLIQACGATPIRVALPAKESYALDVDAIAAAVTPHTRVIFLNTPGNPSGRVFDEESLQALVALCCDKDIWLVSDEVYWTLTYGCRHTSPRALPGGEQVVVQVNSVSKSHAMTGWRLGWAVAPSGLAGNLCNLAQSMLFGVSQFTQDAAAKALAHPLDEVERFREQSEIRRNVLYQGLAAVPGLKPVLPDGGMFMLVDISGLGIDGSSFANALLDEARVVVIPGFAFGDSLTNFVRIGFLQPPEVLQEAVARIGQFVTSLRRNSLDPELPKAQ